MPPVHDLCSALLARRRRTAPRSQRTALKVEQLDPRIALAVDQFWVQPDLPPPVNMPIGSFADPFRSLDQAQVVIRSRLAAGPQRRDIVVNVRGGTYERSEALTFSGADSGKNGRTVTWRAAPGETPVISGSRQITGWAAVADPGLSGLGTNVVWKANVSGLSNPGRDILGLPQFRARQLFIDGVRGTVAETMPSAMPGDPHASYPFGFRPFIGQTDFVGTGTPVNGIVYSDPGDFINNPNALDWRDPVTWGNVEGFPDLLGIRQRGVEAVSRMQWREFRMPVESIGAFAPDQKVEVFSLVAGLAEVPVGLITMQADPWRVATLGRLQAQVGVPGSPPIDELAIYNPWRITQFANSYQFLDQPNEWYHDPVGSNVYLVCAANVDPNGKTIEIPVAESLLKVQGTAAAPVRNLAFRGLTFSGATWLDPSYGAGYVPDQASVIIDAGRNPVTGEYLNGVTVVGHSMFTKATPGNVAVSFARQVEFGGNTFRNLGGVGLQLGAPTSAGFGGVQSVRVVGNTFTGISSCAITVGGVSWARVDSGIDPVRDRSKWVIDSGRRITVQGTDAFPSDRRAEVRDVAILQNTITGTGADYVDAAGILVGYARNTRIENNVISNTSWSGMQIGWGWGFVDSPRFTGVPGSTLSTWLPTELGRPTALGRTRVIGNVITDFVTQVYDGGAIYTSGAQGRGWADATLLKGNLMYGKRPLGGSNIIYTDGGTRWVRVEDNLQYANPQGVWWMGATFAPADTLNTDLAAIPKPFANSPYGSEIGGMIPAGNIRYRRNLWENRWTQATFPLPQSNPGAPGYANLSNWPANPLFFAPAPQPYYDLTTGLSFSGNGFVHYVPGTHNPSISGWLLRRGYGTRWKPGAT